MNSCARARIHTRGQAGMGRQAGLSELRGQVLRSEQLSHRLSTVRHALRSGGAAEIVPQPVRRTGQTQFEVALKFQIILLYVRLSPNRRHSGQGWECLKVTRLGHW